MLRISLRRQALLLHNLALAREARLDYPGADRLVSQAIELKGTSLYRRSRSRIERNKARYLTTMAQRDARTPRGSSSPMYAGPQSPPNPSPPIQSAGHMAPPSNFPSPGNALRR